MPDIPTPQEIYEEGSTRGHARLSASASKRWLLCPGSVKANEGLPDQRSEAADKGTAAHALLEWGLRSSLAAGRMVSVDPVVCKTNKVGPWPVKDLAYAVNAAIEWVWELYSSLLDPELHLEADLPGLQALHPDLGGTCDIILVDRMSKRMWVIDYKNGRGVVDAKNNTQLGLYALGFENSEDYEVELVILQPNTEGPVASRWECPQSWLYALVKEVIAAADLSHQDDPPRRRGECTFCRDAACPERNADFEVVVPEEIRPALDPSACDVHTLRAIKDRADDIRTFLDTVDAEIRARLKVGVPPEELGYKEVEGKGRSAWNSSNEDACEAVADALRKKGVGPYTSKLIGITEARRALGKNGRHLVEAAITVPPGKPKLVPVSDARPAIGFSDFEAVDVE